MIQALTTVEAVFKTQRAKEAFDRLTKEAEEAKEETRQLARTVRQNVDARRNRLLKYKEEYRAA